MEQEQSYEPGLGLASVSLLPSFLPQQMWGRESQYNWEQLEKIADAEERQRGGNLFLLWQTGTYHRSMHSKSPTEEGWFHQPGHKRAPLTKHQSWKTTMAPLSGTCRESHPVSKEGSIPGILQEQHAAQSLLKVHLDQAKLFYKRSADTHWQRDCLLLQDTKCGCQPNFWFLPDPQRPLVQSLWALLRSYNGKCCGLSLAISTVYEVFYHSIPQSSTIAG